MKLVSMKEFVLEQFDLLYMAKISQDQYVTRTKKYADFLKQPLTLGMFVPVDNLGNILQEPSDKEEDEGFFGLVDAIIDKQYREAKERVLFKGCSTISYDINPESFFIVNKNCAKIGHYKSLPKYFEWHVGTIEELTPYDLTLTQSAIKQIVL